MTEKKRSRCMYSNNLRARSLPVTNIQPSAKLRGKGRPKKKRTAAGTILYKRQHMSTTLTASRIENGKEEEISHTSLSARDTGEGCIADVDCAVSRKHCVLACGWPHSFKLSPEEFWALSYHACFPSHVILASTETIRMKYQENRVCDNGLSGNQQSRYMMRLLKDPVPLFAEFISISQQTAMSRLLATFSYPFKYLFYLILVCYLPVPLVIFAL